MIVDVLFLAVWLILLFNTALIVGLVVCEVAVWVAGCRDCRKGALCARCLADSEAIRVKPDREAA